MIRAILCLLVSAAVGGAATLNSPTGSYADVQATINSAVDGDLVNVPAGTNHWTTNIVITTGITLAGAGNDTTVVIDDVPIINNKCELVDGTFTSNQVFRLSGFTFRTGNRTTKPINAGAVIIRGNCPASGGTGSVRIDHNHFDQLYQIGLVFQGWIYGVTDHNKWDQLANAGTVQAINMNNGQSYGGSDYGDGSWAGPTEFGTSHFMFVEDNVMNNLGVTQTTGMIDCQYGGRYINRYNSYTNCTMINGHGTESGGRVRGLRAIDHYRNTCSFTGSMSVGLTRSGTTMYHDNTWRGQLASRHIPLTAFRQDFPYHTFAGSTGTNLWDVNDTEGNGTSVPGHAPFLYFSGTQTLTGTNQPTLQDTNAYWTTDQWIGFIVSSDGIAFTGTKASFSGVPCRIISNTTNTIIFDRTTADVGLKSFTNNATYFIYKVLIGLDQPSRCCGDLLANLVPTNSVVGGIAWPHQVLEPTYGWNNVEIFNGATNPVLVSSSYPTLQENRDFYNGTVAPGHVDFVYPHPLVSGSPITNATLTINSQGPASGITITVSPNDNNSQGNGVTGFSRIYTTNVVVTVTAPATFQTTNLWSKWVKDGSDLTTNLSTTVLMDTDHTMTAVYTPQSAPPTAAFFGFPLVGNAPLSVNFTDQSTGATAWAWTFGDGHTSTSQNPANTFVAVGSYTVSLTVTNTSGSNTLTKTNYVTATAPPSAASTGGMRLRGITTLIP